MINSLCQLLGTEAEVIGVGVEAVISRLADLVVVTAMRAHLAQVSDDSLGWLNALQLIHSSPDKHWRLAQQANKVGMWRTIFARNLSD